MRRTPLITLAAAAVLAAACSKDPPTPPPDPGVAEVEAVISRYFAVWSDGDMDAYRDMFLPEATVHLLASGGQVGAWPRDLFVDGQRQAKAGKPEMREHATDVRITLSPDGRCARATVKWRLVDGPSIDLGWNYFTFLRRDGSWRILHLLFYTE